MSTENEIPYSLDEEDHIRVLTFYQALTSEYDEKCKTCDLSSKDKIEWINAFIENFNSSLKREISIWHKNNKNTDKFTFNFETGVPFYNYDNPDFKKWVYDDILSSIENSGWNIRSGSEIVERFSPDKNDSVRKCFVVIRCIFSIPDIKAK